MTDPHHCDRCGAISEVVETRATGDAVRRRRRCKSTQCGVRWTTYEVRQTDLEETRGVTVLSPRMQALARTALRELAEAERKLQEALTPPPKRTERAVDEPPYTPGDDPNHEHNFAAGACIYCGALV